MSLRFAAAVLGGLVAGGAQSACRVAAAPAETRASYGAAEDTVASDVKAELEQARRAERAAANAKLPPQGNSANPSASTRGRMRGPLNLHFQPFKLGEIINLTEETAIFRFLLPNIDDEFYLEPCSTLQAQKREGAMMIEQLQRLYTPITPCGTKGYFDLLIKKQPQGRMTEHLWSMQPGDALNFRVVLHKLRYLPNVYEHVGMIGTGSGITSLLQVIRASVDDATDRTKLSLLFANPSNKRVLLKGTLDALAAQSEGRFKPYYTVDRVEHGDDEPKWDGFVGLIDANMIRQTMPPPGPKNVLLVCGSDQLLNSLCGTPFAVLKPWSSGQSMQPAVSHGASNLGEQIGGALGTLGYMSDTVYRF